MPIFKSKKEAQDAHREYNIDTNAEGKYSNTKNGSMQIRRISFIVDNVPEDSRVLEVGCNSGGLMRILELKKNCFCNGIDISEKMIAIALKNGSFAKYGTAEEIPYANNTFDCVIMTEVLEHIFEPLEALSEVRRVLKPAGVFVGSVPHKKGYNATRKKLAEHKWHCHEFDEESIKELLLKKFNNVSIEKISWEGDETNKTQWIGWVCKTKEFKC